MNKKLLIPIGLVLVLVIAAGVLAAYKGDDSATNANTTVSASNTNATSISEQQSEAVTLPVSEVPAPAVVPTPTPAAETPAQGVFSGEEEIVGNDLQVFEITYDGNTFSPSALSVKNGDVVIFKNNSKAPFWPASDPHPAHSTYPEFDTKKPVAAGQAFEFKFNRVGAWKFHDHLNPSARGTITVK